MRHPHLTRLALGLGLLALSGQLSTSLHYAIVRHVRCAHGEWSHSASDHASDGQTAQAPVAGSPVHQPQVTASHHGDSDDHAHCGAFTERRRLDRVCPAPDGVVNAAVGIAMGVRLGLQTRAAATLHALAPKTSPPV